MTDGILILTRTDGMSRNEEMKEVFRILDKDKDGFISANDLRTVSRVRQMYRVTSKDKTVKTRGMIVLYLCAQLAVLYT